MKNILKLFIIGIFTFSIFLYAFEVREIHAAQVYPFEGIIHSGTLVIHNEPNFSNSSAVTELAYGTKVTVTGEKNNLYSIIYDNDKSGYASKNYITNVTINTATKDIAGVEKYEDYCKSLENQKFPASYCPYLYYLHYKHPTWIFKPDLINYTLEEVANKEETKISLQTNNSNYFVYKNGEPYINEKSSDGNHYYYIKSNVIASLIDPRNSLFEKTIFQFLNLEKNTEAINEDALAKISSKGNLSKYYKEFQKAATETSINALHLMTRSQQEGADKETYSAVTGKFTTATGIKNIDGQSLDGLYNFYNIGAHLDKNYTSSIQRGLAYAGGFIDGTGNNRPWNTPEKAIIGGGYFIGNQYVKKGQNTIFFQKYNISTYTNYTMFNHQYMTNGGAPLSEGNALRGAYEAGELLETSFEFIIPVYKNMNNDIQQPVNKNSDKTLSKIEINNNLIAGFNNTRTEYEGVNLITNNASFSLTVVPNNSLSKVIGTNVNFVNNKATIKFVNGMATVNFKVVAENETATEYKIVVKQVLPIQNVTVNNVVSKMGVRINDNYMFGISPGTTAETLINTAKKNNGNAVVTDKNGQVKKDNILVTGDKITIKGTVESKTYVIAVRGDINGDGVVKINDLILLQSHILEKVKLTKEKFYAADINYDSNLRINDLLLIQSSILGKTRL